MDTGESSDSSGRPQATGHTLAAQGLSSAQLLASPSRVSCVLCPVERPSRHETPHRFPDRGDPACHPPLAAPFVRTRPVLARTASHERMKEVGRGSTHHRHHRPCGTGGRPRRRRTRRTRRRRRRAAGGRGRQETRDKGHGHSLSTSKGGDAPTQAERRRRLVATPRSEQGHTGLADSASR